MVNIAIYGKGGIGKSTTVSNMAAALAEKGLTVMQIGCDPKADSTTNLLGGKKITTVLDLVRTKGNDFDLSDMVNVGYNGVLCIEAGGPTPGLGCAGRGIIAALEKLKEKGAYETYKPELNCEGKPKVAFVCVHNSCRSQIAEALGKKLASDVFDSYSAGTALKDHINPDAVRLMKQVHGIDMELTQHNKLLSDIPAPDVVIFMGCNVSCPDVPSQYAENWGLDDPTGKSDEIFCKTIRLIENKILQLKEKLSKT